MKKSLSMISLTTLLTFSVPTSAFECTNAGAGGTAPEDFGDATHTACGDGAAASGPGSSTAIGSLAAAPSGSSTAVGAEASSAGTYSTALGAAASAGNGSTAVGSDSAAAGIESTALGRAASSDGRQGTAVGNFASTAGEKSTAVGFRATAPNPNTMVLGSIPGENEFFFEPNEYVDVAIGTTDPLAPLHIFRDDATQEFLLLESNEAATVQDRAMMFLVNNGGIRFEFTNEVLNTAWRFQAATGNQDNFEIAKVGTGEIEFRIDADGNAYVAGLLFENSDRNTKTDIVPVDPEAVLDKVTRLPIAEWAYKESPESRHIGPMAQDFHAAFNTGDSDRRLATMDVSGVAIASIQALESRNRELETRIAKVETLESENVELKKRLALVEALVSQLLPKIAKN